MNLVVNEVEERQLCSNLMKAGEINPLYSLFMCLLPQDFHIQEMDQQHSKSERLVYMYR